MIPKPAAETAEQKKDSAPKEGTTNAFTPGSDINPNLSGGVLITAGQSTNFTNPDSEFPSQAKTPAKTNIAAIDSHIKTASDTESVSTTSSGSAGVSAAATTDRTKGRMIISLTFSD